MAITDLTGPFDDDERDEPVDGGDAENEALDSEPAEAAFEDDVSDADEAEFEADEEAEEFFHGDELPLADEGERLPWLEGDDDEQEYTGYSSGQTMTLMLVVLLGIALIGGGVWWLTRERPDSDLVADGSTIKSEGPYKERPDNPGGKQFEGTDDSSFKVAEGQTAPARLGQGDAEPQPGFDTLDKGSKGAGASPAAKPAGESGAVDEPAVGVQVGAFSDRATAESKWNLLVQQHGALKGLRHRVVEGKADIGTVYRLQALADNLAAARTLCGQLKASRLDCYVKP